MASCCICQFNVRQPRNIFAESIGNPPIFISELVLRCTRGTDFEIPLKTSICKKCTEKLLRYYKSVEAAKQVRQEILELIRSPMIIKEYHAAHAHNEIKADDGTIEYFVEEDDNKMVVNIEQLMQMPKDEEDSQILIENDEEIEEEVLQETIKEDFQLIELDEIENEIVIEEQMASADIEQEQIESDGNNITYEEHLTEVIDTDYDEDEDGVTTDYNVDESSPKTVKSGSVCIISCPECNETFSSKRKYNAHTKREHFPGYVCDQCGKTLQSYSGFVGHLQNHEPIKQFQCTECGERFSRKFRLKHHMAWHSGETPFQCDICSKRFVHKVALYKHKQIHDDDTKRLSCQVCSFKFRTKAHLERHMRSHTGAKPFSCPVCNKRFSQMYNMKAHLREHENPGCNRNRRFRCSKCAHSFVNEEHFKEHCVRNECVVSNKQSVDLQGERLSDEIKNPN